MARKTPKPARPAGTGKPAGAGGGFAGKPTKASVTTGNYGKAVSAAAKAKSPTTPSSSASSESENGGSQVGKMAKNANETGRSYGGRVSAAAKARRGS